VVSIEQENYDDNRPYLYVYRRFVAAVPVAGMKRDLEHAFADLTPWSGRVRLKSFAEEKNGSSVLTICRIGTSRQTFYKIEFLYEPEPQTSPAPETGPEMSVETGPQPGPEPDVAVPSGERTKIRARVAIIIDDMGSEPDRLTRKFLSFPEKLTFAVFPRSEASARKADEARHIGRFDIIIHQPMEAEGARERGIRSMPGTILTNMSDEEIGHVLSENFRSIRNVRGMNNHQGSLATSNPRTMTAVMRWLKARGFYFVDSFTSADSVAAEKAREARIPWRKRDVFLDNEDEERYVQLQLNRLISIALKRGSAVGIGHATRDATIKVLLENVVRMKSLGIEFVYAKDLLEH
jgi:polysaccharide deacetylase 2 family uncharacterized protein YibQ